MGEEHERSKEKEISGRRKSCLDSKKGAQLCGSLHDEVKTNEVQCQSDTRTPSMTSTITSWTSHCGISPVQVQVNWGSKPKNPRLLERFGGGWGEYRNRSTLL